MLDAAAYALITLLVCCALGAALYWSWIVCSALGRLYRWVCWGLRPLLDGVRRLLKWVNWEKLTMFTLAVSLILVTALTLFVPPAPSPAESEFDTGIYKGLRVAFSIFEGDSTDFRAHIINSPLAAGGGPLAHLLVLLACGLPILVSISALGTATTLLWNYLPHHVPIFCRNWYIFSGLDPNSIRMARSLHEDLKKQKDTGVFIFLRTRRGSQPPEVLEDIRMLNYYLYPKTEARFLRWPQRRLRRLRFFFLSENTDENFQRMRDTLKDADARHLFWPLGKATDDSFQQELYLLSETESASMLIEDLRRLLKPDGCFRNTELRLLDRFRATSYDLLRNVPLHKHIRKDSRGDRLHVLVLGFGRIGREFFRAACSLGTLQGCETEFTLCDQQIGAKLNAFLSQCPELCQSVTIHPRKRNLDTSALEKLVSTGDYHYILVALGDDERNIRVASRLKRFYRLRHWEYMAERRTEDIQPQICVNIEDTIKHTYTMGLWDTGKKWDPSLHVFGGLDQVFTHSVLMPRPLWNAARFIHRDLNSDQSPGPLVWSEYERRSSIACAARAEYLCDLVCRGEKRSEYERMLAPLDRSALADTEHLRWMAYVRSEGLRYADTGLMDFYYDRKNGGHVDILGKLTPCLTADQRKLSEAWTHLTTGPHADNYTGKRSFRQRDERLVELSGKIARHADPEK